MQKWKKYILGTDVISLYFALVLALLLRGALHPNAIQNESVWLAAHIFIFLPSVFFSILSLYISGLYDAKIIYDRSKTVVLLFYAQAATAVFTIISFYILRTELTPKLTLFFYILISIFLLSITRSIIYFSLQTINKGKAFLLTENENLKNKVNVSYAPFHLETVKNVEELKSNNVKFQALIYDEKFLNVDFNLYLEKLKQKGVLVYSYNQYYEFLFKKVDLENYYFEDLIRDLGERKESRAQFIFRRFVDIFCAILVLPLFLIFSPIVFILQKLEEGLFSKKSLFTVQDRVGYLGKQVWLYKFRTMSFTDKGKFTESAKTGFLENELGNKVTYVGWFLRKTRIDEIPQVLNLLNGEISFIGPRANIIGFHNEMEGKIKNHNLRLLVPQGLTGWAQVLQATPPRTYEETVEKFAYEVYYVKYRSIFLDISIILKTIKTLISRTGV